MQNFSCRIRGSHVRRITVSVFSMILCLTMLISSSGSFVSMNVSAKSTSQMQREIDDLEQDKKDAESKIAALKGDKSRQEELKAALQAKVSATEKQIAICSGKIDELTGEIKAKEKEIGDKNLKLDESKELFKQRLRAMYMSGSNNELDVLLSAENFADYLAKAELTRSVSEHDRELMDTIINSINIIEESKKIVEEKKGEQTSAKKQLSNKRAELKTQMAEADSAISAISADAAAAQADLDSYNNAINKLESEIKAAIKAAQQAAGSSNIKFTGGTFGWPCPGYYSRSSEFGQRWGRMHTGVDIAGVGIAGKPIVAAADGQVILASFNSGGYGNYVMINHGSMGGSNYVTLYGHMTSYCVSVGQSVKKGQTIGFVGSTGRSTGNHLHYEIRVNGSPQNPMGWYS